MFGNFIPLIVLQRWSQRLWKQGIIHKIPKQDGHPYFLLHYYVMEFGKRSDAMQRTIS